MKRVILLLTCISLSVVLNAQGPAKDYIPRSKAILDLLKAKEFGKVCEQFDTSVSRRLDLSLIHI